MIGYIIKKVIGSRNDREVKRMRPIVAKINEIEASLQPLPEQELRDRTARWKERLHAIEDKDELKAALEEMMPEAFAVVKNACRRLCGERSSTSRSVRRRLPFSSSSSRAITCPPQR